MKISANGLSANLSPDMGRVYSGDTSLGDNFSMSDSMKAYGNTPLRVDDFPNTPTSVVGYRLSPAPSADQALFTFSQTSSHLNQYDALFFGKLGFGERSLQSLSQMLVGDQRVKHLVLPHNGIGDGANMSEFAKAGLADLLKVNHTIGWLILNGNMITSIGAKALAQSLRVNTGVKHVVLADNQIGDEGVMELAQMLTQNTTIESLFIQGNPFGCQGVKALIEAMPRFKSLKRLDIRDCHCEDASLKQHLADLGGRLGIRVS